MIRKSLDEDGQRGRVVLFQGGLEMMTSDTACCVIGRSRHILWTPPGGGWSNRPHGVSRRKEPTYGLRLAHSTTTSVSYSMPKKRQCERPIHLTPYFFRWPWSRQGQIMTSSFFLSRKRHLPTTTIYRVQTAIDFFCRAAICDTTPRFLDFSVDLTIIEL